MYVTDTLVKNNLPLFSCPPLNTPSKQKLQLAALKKDHDLFSRLYLSCQTREGDLEQFFSHENQAVPPSLSQGGKLQLGNKADLMHCLEHMTETVNSSNPSESVILIDGVAVVHFLIPGKAKTFQDYASMVFIPYVIS